MKYIKPLLLTLVWLLLAIHPAAAQQERKRVNLVEATEMDGGAGERWAVVIGISHYREATLTLKYAASDATAIKEVLEKKCGYASDHIKLLVNEAATAANVRNAIGTWLPRVAGRRDSVVIFFSGHGSPDLDRNVAQEGRRNYLVTYEAVPADLASTALPMDELANALLRIRSECTLALLDCCFSGAGAANGVSRPRTFPVEGQKPSLQTAGRDVGRLASSGRGRAILTACEADETAAEYDDLGHGLFTYYLLQGLGGDAAERNGRITPDSLYSFLSRRLADPGTGHTLQTPTATANYAGEPFAVNGAGGSSGTVGTLEVVSSPLGAEVYLDGDAAPHKTPFVLKLPTGLHRVLVVKDDYLPITEEVYVRPGGTTPYAVTLSSRPLVGNLLIQAQPGTELSIDGKSEGKIPDSGRRLLRDLPARSLNVRVQGSGFQSLEKTITIRAGLAIYETFLLSKQLAGKRAPTPADLPAKMTLKGEYGWWETDRSEMAFVSEGVFPMGRAETANASPVHEVNLPAYWIDRYEVTNEQFARFVAETGYKVRGNWKPGVAADRRLPALAVTLDDARAYATWAGKRLPTEAEWEKAARGPGGLLFPYGDTLDPLAQNARSMDYRRAIEVGQLPKGVSPYGVYDLLGNAAEWCDSPYLPYPDNHTVDAAFGRGLYVVRGGSFQEPALMSELNATMRSYSRPDQYASDIGFRCTVSAH